MRHQAHGAEQEEQRHRAQRVGRQADGGIAHRRRRVLAREVGGGEHLDHHKRRQPEREDGECVGRCRRVGRGERAALEQHRDDLGRHDGERRRRRNGEQHGELEAAVLAVHDGGVIAGAQMARHVGQQHDADGDAEDGEGKLVDAVGVVEMRDGALLQRGDDRADDDVELGDAAGDDARDAEPDQAADALRHARPPQPERRSLRRTPSTSSHSARGPPRYAPSLDDAGERLVPQAQAQGDEGRGHHGEVEDDGDGGALDELADRVEHPRQQGNQRHAQQVGHGDAGEQHREVELLRVGADAGGEAVHQKRHGDLGENGERQDHEHQAGHRLLGELARGLLALALELLGEQRHESRVEGALAEQPPEQVGEAEGDEERVRHRARAQSPRSGCRAGSRTRG
jgi:hypothetical protein